MVQNIFVAVITLFAIGVAVWSWWYENHSKDGEN